MCVVYETPCANVRNSKTRKLRIGIVRSTPEVDFIFLGMSLTRLYGLRNNSEDFHCDNTDSIVEIMGASYTKHC